MAKIIKPPTQVELRPENQSVFLAGSIEMGKAVDWQKAVEEEFAHPDYEHVVILNPRRDDWDSSWEQRISNSNFYGQVDWEVSCLEKADVILMYFAPGTMSPISLLELGLFATSGKLVVACPEGFWRLGNVEYVCKKYNIPMHNTLAEAVAEVAQRVK